MSGCSHMGGECWTENGWECTQCGSLLPVIDVRVGPSAIPHPYDCVACIAAGTEASKQAELAALWKREAASLTRRAEAAEQEAAGLRAVVEAGRIIYAKACHMSECYERCNCGLDELSAALAACDESTGGS